MAVSTADTATRRPRTGHATRWDVQALRALAVSAVVLYHLWPARLPGGFVGVDVFFVISGFLITGHLLRELERTGRIALGAFWGRRAKRLLPAAFTTILVTGAAVLLVVPASLWSQYGRELIASTVYLQNWQLAADAVDYLAQSNAPSPFQHFWSLSVEEQFYIALPLLLLGALAVAGRRRAAGFRVARVLLGTVLVVSFVWCVVQTVTSPGVAYFSTATRAWEFALGGLASTVRLPAVRTTTARTVRVVGAWTGVAAIAAALFVIRPTTPFPGWAAALPVVGASLVVLFGGASGLQRVGRWAPIAFTGRISYALYLWHWPAVVLVPIVTGHPLTATEKLAVLVGSVLLATASTLLVEEPLRAAPWLSAARPRRVGVLGVVGTVVVVALGASTLTAAHVAQERAAAAAERIASGDVACFGAAARIGFPDPCVNRDLADVRVPGPAAIGGDDANEAACWTNASSGDAFKSCRLGPETGWTKRIIAIGDSHNNALIGVYRAMAERYGWRIDVAGHARCYLTDGTQQVSSAAEQASCEGWRRNAFRYIGEQADRTDAVFVTHSTGDATVDPGAYGSVEDATVAGLAGAWRRINDVGVPVIALRDNPVTAYDVVTCTSRMAGPTDGSCDAPRAEALRFDGSAEAARLVPDATVVDLTRYMCTDDVCPAVIGGVVVHRDNSHLSATFAATLAPALGRAVDRALQDDGSARR